MALQDMFIKSPPSEEGTSVDMPATYRETVSWLPKLGDIVPDFHAQSTEGRIDFHSWAEGSWTILFAYPKNRGGISETEIASLAMHQEEFNKRNVRAIGLSPSSLGENLNWRSQIERLFNLDIRLPLMADPTCQLCKSMGMIHPKDPTDLAIRKTMLIDPSLRLRWMAEYPTPLGRSVEELFRVIDGLQVFDETNLGVPMDWQPGDPGVVRPDVSTAEARALYGDKLTLLSSEIRMVSLPADRNAR